MYLLLLFAQAPIFSNSKKTSTWLYSAATVISSVHFVIEITIQLWCFSNSRGTSTCPLSAAASSAVKSHFLAICTLLPLLSNCQFTYRWTLPPAALTGILPSLPVISPLTSWFSNNPNINVAIKGCCFERSPKASFCTIH